MIHIDNITVRAKKKPVLIPKKKSNTKPIPKILLQRGRKSQNDITNDMKENYQIQKPRYVPIKPRDEQIDELQYTMETGNKHRSRQKKKSNKVSSKPKLSLTPQQLQKAKIQSRMEELLAEIQDRQQFLIEMKQINSPNYNQYEIDMNYQISIKSQEFKQLDMKLKAMNPN